MEWTDETIARLKELWAEGLSTAEIGRRLSITKNAVVGKAHRLSLPPRPSPIRRSDKSKAATPESAVKAAPVAAAPVKDKAPQPVPPAADTQPAPVPAASVDTPASKPAAPQPKAAEVKPARVEKAPAAPRTPAKPKTSLRSISDPEPKKRRGPSCCWPIGDPGTPGFHFCGATPLPGKPYCAEHAQIAYVKLRDRRDNVA